MSFYPRGRSFLYELKILCRYWAIGCYCNRCIYCWFSGNRWIWYDAL